MPKAKSPTKAAHDASLAELYAAFPKPSPAVPHEPSGLEEAIWQVRIWASVAEGLTDDLPCFATRDEQLRFSRFIAVVDKFSEAAAELYNVYHGEEAEAAS